MCENRPDFVWIAMGLAKAGLTAALINHHLRHSLLRHALELGAVTHLIASARCAAAIRECFRDGNRDAVDGDALHIWWIDAVPPPGDSDAAVTPCEHDLAAACDTVTPERPDRACRAGVRRRDAMFLIYTSGTTGKSKAARFSNARFIGASAAWLPPCGLTSADRYYITLPLYHGNAMVVALSPCLYAGCTVVLRERFSVSHFLDDIRRFRCTAMIYIGELWRYLYLTPARADDACNPLRVIVGNGLRGDIWPVVTTRFGIETVVEHYGATEMPGGAVLNWTNRVGSCGYVPPAVRAAARNDCIVRHDVEAACVVRDARGRCIACAPNEEGELIMRLPDGLYDGYTDAAATERKIYRDVFEPGDAWWASGDILRIDADGFYYFVDRSGDSFRWKGENVSTNEVCEVVAAFPHICEANVYGVAVPGYPGKACMASIVVDAPLDMHRLHEHLKANLPAYARPLFLRVRDRENDKTSTFKFQKHVYAAQGFNPSSVSGGDRLYFGAQDASTYVPLTSALYADLCAGRVRVA